MDRYRKEVWYKWVHKRSAIALKCSWNWAQKSNLLHQLNFCPNFSKILGPIINLWLLFSLQNLDRNKNLELNKLERCLKSPPSRYFWFWIEEVKSNLIRVSSRLRVNRSKHRPNIKIPFLVIFSFQGKLKRFRDCLFFIIIYFNTHLDYPFSDIFVSIELISVTYLCPKMYLCAKRASKILVPPKEMLLFFSIVTFFDQLWCH